MHLTMYLSAETNFFMMHFSCPSGAVQSRMTSCTGKDTLPVDKCVSPQVVLLSGSECAGRLYYRQQALSRNYDNGIDTKFVHLIGAGQDDLGCAFESACGHCQLFQASYLMF